MLKKYHFIYAIHFWEVPMDIDINEENGMETKAFIQLQWMD